MYDGIVMYGIQMTQLVFDLEYDLAVLNYVKTKDTGGLSRLSVSEGKMCARILRSRSFS